jgi:fluoroquinolone resistance protein
MNSTHFDIIFEKQDFNTHPLEKGDYENCSFIACLFPVADLSDINFSDCVFSDCDLSMANMNNTALRNISFKGCKMLGLQFGKCNAFLFSAGFNNCILDHSSFFRLKARKTIFRDCRLLEADFTETDLGESVFNNCDLSGATFDNSMLEKADFRSSHHYSIDPSTNRIKKAMFSQSGLAGLLDRHDIVIE